jgi:hypothetical protein
MKGFWNDPDGLSIEEFAAILVLPLFLFVGIKLAMTADITGTQVDFFTVLTYPILAVVARKAVERVGFPVLGKRQQAVAVDTDNYGAGYGAGSGGYDAECNEREGEENRGTI